jgi:hypothetical protein
MNFKKLLTIINLKIESNVLSKTGLRTEIGQLLVEISLLCHYKTSEIILLGNIKKQNEKEDFFFVENHILDHV